uniref:Homeobox domain-containing protein n=1 Tax=Leersia perrieri TaxID=77586 RepID=A0A0D9XMH1_9ORYZ
MEMMVHGRRDDQHHLGLGLGLSLSLSLGAAANDQPAAAAPRHVAAAAHVSPSPFFSDRRSTAACHDEMIAPLPFLRGIDVNRTPAAAATARGASCSEEEEETGASSPNSTLSSLSGKRGAPAGSSRATAAGAGSDDEDSGGGGGGSRKKLRLSKDQAAVLEETFKEHNTLNPKQKAALARDLKLKPRQVEVWFQNRRARTKLKQTEGAD